ncbi:hypothetical protein EV426DRAFT_583340 [Tirmania nivea]|nr:hypothetical protein EV426DRAFT_583340 [Tirmania nivea]
MSSPLRFSTRDRARSSSSASHDKFGNDNFSRSYSPLLALQHLSSGRAELSPPSPINSPLSKRSSYLNSPPFVPVSVQSPGTHYGPTGGFFLPSPVTSYAYAQTKSIYDMQRSPMYNLQQQVKALTVELQELLDAQSTGLLMEHPYRSPIIKKELEVMEASRNASKTGRSGWDGGVTYSVMPDRTRVGPKINLGAARQGIVKAIKALADVKSMEEGVYAMEEAERLKNIGQAEEWENKKMELEERIKEVEEGGEARRVVELRKEREDVEFEIRKVEVHLAALKSRYSNLQTRITGLESTLSSRSSSYRHSLSKISSLQTRFFSSLPTKFGSHEVAVDHWKAEAGAIREKKEQARLEHEALKNGVVHWEEALAIVRGFEEGLKRELASTAATTPSGRMEESSVVPLRRDNVRRNSTRGLFTASIVTSPGAGGYSSPSTFLGNRSKSMTAANSQLPTRSEMEKPSLTRSDTLISNSDDEGQGEVPDDLYVQASPKAKSRARGPSSQEGINQLILKGIEEVLQKLDEKVQLAESKNWRLLVCCLAAEAQAFREAREIMLKKMHCESDNNQVQPILEKNEPKVGLFGDPEEGVGLKSKFGRMELGSKLGNAASRCTITERLGSKDTGHDSEDVAQDWGDIHDFGGVGLMDNEETRPFGIEMEMTPMQNHSLSQSSLQDSSSMSVSPKTPSQRGSLSSKTRKLREGRRVQEGIEGMDGSGWGREADGYGDEESEEDNDNATVKGSIHEGNLQFLKGPTVGQVMRRQGSSGGGVPGGSGMGMESSGPSGIALGLGAGWGRIRSPGLGSTDRKEGGGFGRESLMLG